MKSTRLRMACNVLTVFSLGLTASVRAQERVWVGISTFFTPRTAPAFPGADCKEVAGVLALSPAAKAGIQIGDLICAVDGALKKGNGSLLPARRAPGTTLSLGVSRGGIETTIRVLLERAPVEESKRHYAIATVAFEKGDLRVAESEMYEASAFDPENPLISYNLATIIRGRNPKLAMAFLDRAIELGLPEREKQASERLRAEIAYELAALPSKEAAQRLRWLADGQARNWYQVCKSYQERSGRREVVTEVVEMFQFSPMAAQDVEMVGSLTRVAYVYGREMSRLAGRKVHVKTAGSALVLSYGDLAGPDFYDRTG